VDRVDVDLVALVGLDHLAHTRATLISLIEIGRRRHEHDDG
jgi:hypothetical protein